jgi:TonB family protein
MMILGMIAAASLALAGEGARGAVPARANLSSYFNEDDYPMTALRRGIQGTTAFELRIGADGRVTRCTVTSSSGDAALDAVTCSVLLSRAEYSPARDSRGRAIPARDSGRVTWRLPETTEDEPFQHVRAPVRIEMTFGKDENERPICSARMNGGPAGTDGEQLCAAVIGPDTQAALDIFPRNSAVTFNVSISLQDDPVPPAADVERGTLFVDATADLTVAADGRVSACLLRETNYHGTNASIGVPTLCSFPGFHAPMFPTAPANAAPRHGVMRLELYLRTGPAHHDA